MAITLKDYQQEGMKKILNVPKNLICVKAGKGKTLISIFAARYMLKHDMIDKAIFCGTLTSINSFVKAFNKQLGQQVKVVTSAEEFIEFFQSDKKILLCKHSMFENIGSNANYLKMLEKEVQTRNLRVYLVIDEAHNLSNAAGVGSIRSTAGVGHRCFERCRFLFSRITLATATPYSSCLSQFYGLVHLIYPQLWATPKIFWTNHIQVKEVRDWKTGKFLRYDKEKYINLAQLRKIVEPFTYFYYPVAKLHFVEHHTRLHDYTKYNERVMGVMTQEDIDKAMKKAEEKAEKERLKKEKKASKKNVQ